MLVALQCPLVSGGKYGMKAGQSRVKADVRQQVKSGMNSWLLPIPKMNGSDSFLEIPKRISLRSN